MTMIKEITVDELDTIDSLMNRFIEAAEGQAPPNFIYLVKTSVSDGKAFLYGAFSDDNLLLG